MLVESYSKGVKRWIEKVRLPSAQCQACLSDKSPDRDFIFTCQLCQSSIHSKHYGREIEDPKEQALDKWYCQRCRMICELAEQQREEEIENMKCHFCPSFKGILKRVIFNNTDTIWLHPECSTWPYPIIYQKNNRRIHYNSQYPSRPTGKFWVNFQTQAEAQCQICNDKRGHKIKCMYYTCQKYFHCSCAKTIGFIRDLESMRFDNSETYIPPYCQQHIEKRITDCQIKAKKYKTLKDENKASHFAQMAITYAVQHKNMQNSAKKFEEDEKIRKQMQYQAGENQDIMEDLSFQQATPIQSRHSSDFYDFVFDADYPKRTRPLRRTSFLHPPSRPQLEPNPPNANAEQANLQQQINTGISLLLKKVSENRPPKNYQRESQLQESEWHSSQDFYPYYNKNISEARSHPIQKATYKFQLLDSPGIVEQSQICTRGSCPTLCYSLAKSLIAFQGQCSQRMGYQVCCWGIWQFWAREQLSDACN